MLRRVSRESFIGHRNAELLDLPAVRFTNDLIRVRT